MYKFLTAVIFNPKKKHTAIAEDLNYTVSNLYKLQQKFNKSHTADKLDIQIVANNGIFNLSGTPYSVASLLLLYQKNGPSLPTLPLSHLLDLHLSDCQPLPSAPEAVISLAESLIKHPLNEKTFFSHLFPSLADGVVQASSQNPLHHFEDPAHPLINCFKEFIRLATISELIPEQKKYVFELNNVCTLYLVIFYCPTDSFLTQKLLPILYNLPVPLPLLTSSWQQTITQAIETTQLPPSLKESVRTTLATLINMSYLPQPPDLPRVIYLSFNGEHFMHQLVSHDIITLLNPQVFKLTRKEEEATLILTNTLPSLTRKTTLNPEAIFHFQSFDKDYQEKRHIKWLIDHL